MTTEEIALAEVEKELHRRGFASTRTGKNSRHGDIHAGKGDKLVRRLEVKGLKQKSAVWLKKRQINAVHIVVIYVVKDKDVWVFSPAEAHSLLDAYRSDFISRNGRPPAEEGFNQSQFPRPTGWGPLDGLL